MEDIILRISKNHIFGLGSLISLGIATYFIKRYLSNTTATTNGHYIKDNEHITLPNNTTTPIYIFWNGDINSTYLLIDQLLQDKIIQPLYIERYTIFKALEYETLEKMTAEYNRNKANPDSSGNDSSGSNSNKKVLEYLEDVARLKRQQSKEIAQLDFIRKLIVKQYPEFRNNLLPTRYITTITKDLALSQIFFDQVKQFSHLEYQGIEFYEQALRYIKHEPNINGRVMLGYCKDSRLMKIIKKIENKLQYQMGTKLEIPLENIDNQAVRYLATEIMRNDIMRVLLS